MKCTCLLLLTICMLGATRGGDDVLRTEQKKLEGDWIVTSTEFDGEKSDEFSGMKLTFAGQTLTVRYQNQEKKGTYKIDPAKKPKELDMVSEADAKSGQSTIRAIYELDGDSLKICAAENTRVERDGKVVTIKEGKRPTAFDSKQGGLMILKRDHKSGD